jgi:hypothetical protein
MISNRYHSLALAKSTAKWLTMLAICGLQGCLSPMALDYAVIEYDKTSTAILSKLILLNIARSHQHQPMHFTGVSNIAATFNFQFNAGATPALTGENGALMTPVFGGTVSENPTISIVPIEGEEFTRRLLTPIQENKLTLLLRQGADVDFILRLLGGELRINGGKQQGIYYNKPSDARGYRMFRQVVLHMSTIQDRNNLFVEPLIFEQHWILPAESLTAEQMATLQNNFRIDYQALSKQVKLSKRETGHIVLTNYDPSILSNEERIQLNEEADQGADNDVMVDIRPGYPGGEWPIHGVFRLRSFQNILNFIGQSISENPEFNVARYPQTPNVSQNPVDTMAVLVSDDKPWHNDISVQYGDSYYAIKPDDGYPWNREAFRLLCQLFQMTMTDLARKGAPIITIDK